MRLPRSPHRGPATDRAVCVELGRWAARGVIAGLTSSGRELRVARLFALAHRIDAGHKYPRSGAREIVLRMKVPLPRAI